MARIRSSPEQVGDALPGRAGRWSPPGPAGMCGPGMARTRPSWHRKQYPSGTEGTLPILESAGCAPADRIGTLARLATAGVC
eukprot:4445214-Prymnesium_polylepis.1